VLRGGSWLSHRDSARAGNRNNDHPGYLVDRGFRVLCASPIC